MDLRKSADSQYEEYENLLLERDQLAKEANQIWTVYLSLFGQLMADVYEEKVECIKCKKVIAYYQNALNHGGAVDAAAMQEYLNREMAAYYAQLKRMLKESEQAKNAGRSTPYEAQRAKTLYRRLAKLIHPDINPLTDISKELQELWQRTQIAYRTNNVKELSELEVLVRRYLKESGLDAASVEIPGIEDKIEELKAEISDIVSNEPYTLRDLVEDDEASGKKTAELEAELESYQKYHRELNEVIFKMLQGGDLRIYVE